MKELRQAVAKAAKDLFNVKIEPELSRPDEQFGDWATNAAMQLVGKLDNPPADGPRAIAQQLADHVKGQASYIKEVSVAGPGFINFKLTDEALAQTAWAATDLSKPNKGREVLVEFGDPNPFKEMHIGHLYSYVAGDAICRLLEVTGADVKRLSYHGDVGLHVAKALWGMLYSKLNGDDLDDDTIKQNIGVYYAKGAKAYDEDEDIARRIQRINEHIYKQDDENIGNLYKWGKDKSLRYFREILDRLGIKTDKQYFESESALYGEELVHKHLGSVFQKSDGAIIYDGEKAGLHTRVFINSRGLPTYEAKDLGLAELKNRDYPHATRSIIITANEQSEYFKVMLAALSEFDKELADKTTHLAHGFVSLSSGKMSSRTGEVYGAATLLDDVEEKAKKMYQNAAEFVTLGAVKYEFLKNRLGGDIVYSIEESVGLEGNSGPYIQYAHARARSILAKANSEREREDSISALEPEERSLARKIGEYTEVVEKAAAELLPHYVCTYLYELAQAFNSFYEKNRVIGDEREATRLKLVSTYADVLKNGLNILGITAPDKM